MIVDIWQRRLAGPAYTEFRRRSVAGSAPVHARFGRLCRSDFTVIHGITYTVVG